MGQNITRVGTGINALAKSGAGTSYPQIFIGDMLWLQHLKVKLKRKSLIT